MYLFLLSIESVVLMKIEGILEIL